MSDETAVPGQLDRELITDAPPGYRLLKLLWDDEIGTSNAASSTAGGPRLGLRLLRARIVGRGERRRLRDAFLAVTAVTPHRGILTVHEAGFTADDRPYLVTDLPQDTMERRLTAAGPLTVPEAAAVGHTLAGALNAAHADGVLHQDVRPGTVVLSAEGTPLLADFGVAAAVMSVRAEDLPPQALVHAAREVFGWETAGPAADVHGLASTIYTMLAGQPPYHAEALLGRAALYQRVLRGAPPPVPAPGVPARLSALLADMMAPDPASRPALPEVMSSLAELAEPAQAGRRAGAPPTVTAGAAAATAQPDRAGTAQPDRAGTAQPAQPHPSGSPAKPAASSPDAAHGPAGRIRPYATLALLLAISVTVLLAGVVWGALTAPGSAPPSSAATATGQGTADAVPVSGTQQAIYRPRGVTVAAAGAGVRVSWSAPNEPGAVAAYLVVAARNGQAVQEKTLVAGQLSALFTGLPAGRTYCFVVGSLLDSASGTQTATAAPVCATARS